MAPDKRKVSLSSSGSYARSPARKRPSNRNPEGLLKKLLIIFCLLGLIAVGANVKFLLDTSAEIREHIETGPDQQVKRTIGQPEDSVTILQASRQRIVILLGITVICFGSVVYLFFKRVVVPLNLVTQIAGELSRGNLSVSALRNPHGDLGDLGVALNDLAANFQEVLLLMGTTVGNCSSTVERIEKALETRSAASLDDIREQLENIKTDLVLLRSLVQEFEFYQTRFDGQKVVSDNIGREC